MWCLRSIEIALAKFDIKVPIEDIFSAIREEEAKRKLSVQLVRSPLTHPIPSSHSSLAPSRAANRIAIHANP